MRGDISSRDSLTARRPKSVRFQEDEGGRIFQAEDDNTGLSRGNDRNSAQIPISARSFGNPARNSGGNPIPILVSRNSDRSSAQDPNTRAAQPDSVTIPPALASNLSASNGAAAANSKNENKNGVFSSLSAAFKSVFLHDPAVVEEKMVKEALTMDAKSLWYSGNGEYHRTKGNELFQQGKFAEAIKHYTCAIELDEDSHFIRSNRSACFHQTGRYQEALHDARIAILKAPKWYKGYCRKAASHVALGELEDARREYAAALELEPNDQLVVQALAEVKAQIAREQARARARGVAASLVGQTAPVELVLSNQALGDEGARILGEALAGNQTVARLWLDGNGVGDAGASALAAALARNRALAVLGLAGNDVGDAGATALAAALVTNRCLKELLLEGNRVGLRGGEALARALEDNPHIYRIGLGQNRILADGIDPADGGGGGGGGGGVGAAFRRSLRLRECDMGAGLPPWDPAGAGAGDGRDCRSCGPTAAAAAAAGGHATLRTCTAIPGLFFGGGGGGGGGAAREPAMPAAAAAAAAAGVGRAASPAKRRGVPLECLEDDLEEPGVDV